MRQPCVNSDWLCLWERAIFYPPQNRHPSTDHQQICQWWLRRRPLRLCQIRCISVHAGLLGIWVKYNQNYFYLYPFFEELTYRSDPSTDFHAWWLKWRGLALGCAFWGNFSHCSPFRGQKPPNPQFLGVNRRFEAKLAKSKNVHIIKTTTSIPTKFCTVIKTTKCLRGWSSHMHYKSKMADGRHLGKIEKSLYLSRGLTDFDEIWHTDGVRPSWPFRPLKISKFQKLRMAAAAILKNPKSRYLDNCLTDRHKIWHGDEIRQLRCVPPLAIYNFKNPTWQRPPFWKIVISRPQFQRF